MKIQSLNNVYFCKQNCCSEKTGSHNEKNLSFKNYTSAMHDALYKDYLNKNIVSKELINLYSELAGSQGVYKNNYVKFLDYWFSKSPLGLLKELCKPIADIKPELRDIVFESEKKYSVPILELNNINSLYISNSGKQGFFNTLFNNQAARNDVKIAFFSPKGYLELSMKKDNAFVLEQAHDGYSTYNYINAYSGERYDTKDVDRNATSVSPF